jgi:hypothetical protein
VCSRRDDSRRNAAEGGGDRGRGSAGRTGSQALIATFRPAFIRPRMIDMLFLAFGHAIP